ncbi:MAG: 23S rRNA (pseudouridine(1915)-N(3))-methyltransferase RlmH [Caldimicrobium sp.]
MKTLHKGQALIHILAPGPLNYSFVKEGLNYYGDLVKKWVKVEYHFPKIKERFLTKEERLRGEAEILNRLIPKKAYLIVLDERGKTLSTREFSELLKKELEEKREVVFIIGGPEGLAEDLKKRANFLLKLSDFTLNHEITLLVLIEAIFRALSIVKGHPYHRE